MQRLRLAVATVVLGVLLPACLAAPAGAQTRAGTARLVTQALDGIGGRSAITGLRTFRLQTTGRTFIFDEGLRPDNTVTPASTFTQTLNAELRGSGDRLRADNVRTSQGAARTVSEVIKGRLGYITGVDANNAQPATTAMTSDRWAAVRREQQLLNPHLLLRDLIARPRLATTFPSTTINGRAHRLLVINDPVSPIRLYVDARTGRIDRLSTADHQYLRRDVRLIVDFSDWRFVRGGTGSNRVRVRFPRTVSIRLDGKVIHTETRSSIAVNRPASATRFQFPSGIAPRYSATLAARGAATTEFLMSFAQDGFPKDGPADQIVPRAVAPGSTLIQGIPNNSMIVEQSNGVVVVEGALSDFRAEALIRYIQKTYPGKPVRYVTASHHHADHAGGMRPFVALGATAVIGADAVPLFRRVFSNRNSQLLPDRLDGTSRAATINAVGAGGFVTLNDSVRPVIVLAEPTQHATTTILVFVPDQGVLFVNGDTYTPGAPPGPGAQSLEQTIERNGLAVKQIVGGHGGVISYAAFRSALGLPPA